LLAGSTQLIYTNFDEKLAHGPRKKLLDFGGSPDHVTSELRSPYRVRVTDGWRGSMILRDAGFVDVVRDTEQVLHVVCLTVTIQRPRRRYAL